MPYTPTFDNEAAGSKPRSASSALARIDWRYTKSESPAPWGKRLESQAWSSGSDAP